MISVVVVCLEKVALFSPYHRDINNKLFDVFDIVELNFTGLPEGYDNYVFDFQNTYQPTHEQIEELREITKSGFRHNVTFVITEKSKATAIASFFQHHYKSVLEKSSSTESIYSPHLGLENVGFTLRDPLNIVVDRSAEIYRHTLPLLKPELVRGVFVCPGYIYLAEHPKSIVSDYVALLAYRIDFNSDNETKIFAQFDNFVEYAKSRPRRAMPTQNDTGTVPESSFTESMKDPNVVYDELPEETKQRITREQWMKMVKAFAKLLDERRMAEKKPGESDNTTKEEL